VDRKIEDRKMKGHPIFLSSIFLSSCLSAARLQQVSSQSAKDFDYCSTRRGAWEGDSLHPPDDRARLPNRRCLFGFSNKGPSSATRTWAASALPARLLLILSSGESRTIPRFVCARVVALCLNCAIDY